MKIQITNIEDYILFLCCLCGELDMNTFSSHANYGTEYLRRSISLMVSNKTIRKFKYSHSAKSPGCVFFKNKSQLRITKPKGEGAVIKLSPELFWHYNLIVPERGRSKTGEKTGGRFTGGAVMAERRRRQSKIIQHLYFHGAEIDYLESVTEQAENRPADTTLENYVIRKSIFDKDGNLLKPETIFSKIEKDKKYFFTIKALSKYGIKIDARGKNMMFRSFGVLLRNDIACSVYLISGIGETWHQNNEKLSGSRVRELINPLGEDRRERGRGAAILYTPDKQVTEDFFFAKEDKRKKVKPEGVYDTAYILPIEESSAALEDLLLIKDFHKKIIALLLREVNVKIEEDRPYDAIALNQEVYSLFGNDIVKIKKVKEWVGKSSAILLIEEWQEETIRKFFANENLTIWVYSKEELREIVEILRDEE